MILLPLSLLVVHTDLSLHISSTGQFWWRNLHHQLDIDPNLILATDTDSCCTLLALIRWFVFSVVKNRSFRYNLSWALLVGTATPPHFFFFLWVTTSRQAEKAAAYCNITKLWGGRVQLTFKWGTAGIRVGQQHRTVLTLNFSLWYTTTHMRCGHLLPRLPNYHLIYTLLCKSLRHFTPGSDQTIFLLR